MENIDINDYFPISYKNGSKLYFDKRYKFQDHLNHKRRTRRFLYHKNLLEFLSENPEIRVFFTLNSEVAPFVKIENDYLINIDSYIAFCKLIQSNTQGRAKAFLGHQLKLANLSATEAEKQTFIQSNITTDNLVAIINGLSDENKEIVVKSLKSLKGRNDEIKEGHTISQSDFIDSFSAFLSDEKVQRAFMGNIPKVQLSILKADLEFLESNLAESETFIQNWIDEDEGKYRKQRCLIFGVEYVDPKREGRLNEKRFDVLAEQNRQNHVLIELKSPNAEVFKITEKPNLNGGISTEYEISQELARAIPQILGYKKWYTEASSEEIQALGIDKKRNISRCIVVIGQSKNDDVWKDNFYRLKESFNIEIWTYSDLIDKLKNTITNLEQYTS